MKQQTNYDYVDLDLPSGTLWATCNVGANNPWEYGKYFQWGDTEGYYDNEEHDFSWKKYKWCNGNYNSLTKYNNNSRFGVVDNKTTLDLEDDAAHVNMGGDWRMPTQDEIQELVDNTYRDWVENHMGSGVNGGLFTSKKDTSKSIFIPTSGFRCDYSVYRQGSDANLWGSTLYMRIPTRACELYFDLGYNSYNDYRYHGFCVRGVKKGK